MESTTEIVQQLKTAISIDRADIVRSITAQLEENDTETLQNVLNNPCCEEGTVLHLAAKNGKTDIVRTLLSAGSDPGIHNTRGQTAFDLASESNQVITVFNEELLQATAQSNIGRVCQLLASGVDVNLVDSEESRNTPLHWAASYGTPEVVQCLCARGSKVDTVNSSGYTPLHEAIKRKDAAVVGELLAHGADAQLTVQMGEEKDKDAVSLASDCPEVLNVLKNPPELVTTELVLTDDNKTDEKPDKTPLQNGTVTPPNPSPKLKMPNGIANGPIPQSPQLRTPTFVRNMPFNQDITQPPQPVITEEKMGLLWPQPQHIFQKDGKPFSPERPHVYVYVSAGPSHNCREVVRQVYFRRDMFEMIGYQLLVDTLSPLADTRKPHILCHVNQRLCPTLGAYKIFISENQLKIVCGDNGALHSALSTVYQLFLLYLEEKRTVIPPVLVDDWPDVAYRGVLFDISQGRLPQLITLKETINNLALMKANQVHLFCRFGKSKTQSWQLTYSKSEIMAFEEICTAYGIKVVPVLEVAPLVQFEDIEYLYGVLQDFLSCFHDAEFISLGPRLSSFVLDTDDELIDISDALKILPLGSEHTLQLCGYPLHELDTGLLKQLPPNIVINEYGIEADHDFRRYCRPLSNLGISFCVCPGTSAWNSLSGCPEAAINNIFLAAKCAVSQGALGMIVCNWSGKGHMTHQPFSWPGYVLGTGLGWNSSCHQDYLYSNLGELMNRYVFQDIQSVVGHVIVELGRAETYLIRCTRSQSGSDVQRLPDDQGSTMFQFFINPDSVPLEHISIDAIQRTMKHIKRCQKELDSIDMKCSQVEKITAEIQLTCDLMMLSTRICRALVLSGKNPSGHGGFPVVNLGVANLPATAKTDLANRLLELVEPYRACWTSRYLEHVGMTESVNILHTLLKIFLPNQETSQLLQAKDS